MFIYMIKQEIGAVLYIYTYICCYVPKKTVCFCIAIVKIFNSHKKRDFYEEGSEQPQSNNIMHVYRV